MPQASVAGGSSATPAAASRLTGAATPHPPSRAIDGSGLPTSAGSPQTSPAATGRGRGRGRGSAPPALAASTARSPASASAGRPRPVVPWLRSSLVSRDLRRQRRCAGAGSMEPTRRALRWSAGERRSVMAVCETCGNDYDKAFQVTMRGHLPHLRQLRVRDPGARAHLRPLRHPDHRPRARERRHLLSAATTAPRRPASAACATASEPGAGGAYVTRGRVHPPRATAIRGA